MPKTKISTPKLAYPPEPLWTERIFQTNTGEDFLGIQSVQNNIVDYLLPGIITITTRARYYSFYSWLIFEYGHGHPKGWSLARFIKRREQAFVFGNLIHHSFRGRSDRVGGLLGSNELSRHVAAHKEGDTIPYHTGEKDKSYLKAAEGGYSTYAGVMSALGIVRYPDDKSNKLELLPMGEELAYTFAQSIQGTAYYAKRSEYDESSHIPKDVLLEYGERCYLNSLSLSPDSSAVLEALFCFESKKPLPDPRGDGGTRSNMKGTLGLILDIIQQSDKPVGEHEFRQAIVYSLCDDFSYQPLNPFEPFIAHWQMFQLREYYTYALYAIWEYFLSWLRRSGPQSLESFWQHLDQEIDLNTVPEALKVQCSALASPSSVTLADYTDWLLTAHGIAAGNLQERCVMFAKCSIVPLSEESIFQILNRQRKDASSLHVGAAWMLLINLYLRLHGIHQNQANQPEWYWAGIGGARRRSPELFIEQMSASLEAGYSVLDVWKWLWRDYIVAQHTITALEKWNYRNANTFHFNYVDGLFEWVRDDHPSYSASRFNRAYDMLFDLGLFVVDENGVQTLTQLGEQTLQRITDSLND